jgi:hypothetical protein
MARRDQVLSLFGASPAQVLQRIREEDRQFMSQMRTPESRVGFGLGRAIGRAFGGEDPRVAQARQRQAIAQGIQAPMGTSGYFAEAAQRFQEQGMTESALAAVQQAQILRQAEQEKAQAQRAQTAAVEFVSKANPKLGSLVESGAMDPKDAIEAVRKDNEPIKVGDVLVNVDPETNKAAVLFDARQRKPQTKYVILTDDEKKTLGLPEGVQYQKNVATGEVKKIAGGNLPQMGTIPQGYHVVVNTDAQNRPIISMEPIPGSPQARELAKSVESVRAGKRGKVTKFNQIVAPSIDLAIEIAQDPENWATGKSGAFIEQLGRLSGGIISAETSRLALTEQLTTIRANIGFDRLQRMRDESPTGGALGQVALQELYALQNSITPLNPNMTSEELIAGLKKVKKVYRSAVEKVANDLTDEQLIKEGLGDLIPFRTATPNPDGSSTPLEPAEEPEFDISVLPEDIQKGWPNLDDATKQALMEAYK